MLERSFHILLIGVLLLVSIHSCAPAYRAGIPVQPVLTERGDFEVRGGFESSSAHVNASYAVTNFLYLSGGGLGWSSQNSQSYFGEFGLGVFSAEKTTGGGLNVFGGYGISEVYDGSWIAQENPNWWIEPGPFKGDYFRWTAQPYFYVFTNHLDFTIGLRNSLVQWQSPSIALGQQTGIDLFMSPHLSVRFGAPNMKFILDAGLQLPVTRSFQHANMTLHLGLGMSIMGGKRVKSAMHNVEEPKQ